VKVADFGLAKIVDSLTMLRTMCGTPSYLAPEVVKQENQEGYDNAVDSWSVGVIVFSMVTNSSPFIEDENQRDVRTRIIERRIDWGTLTNSGVSLDAQSLIRSLLEENPLRRMSLTNALGHPWLASYCSVYNTRPHQPSGSPDLHDGSIMSSIADSLKARFDSSRAMPLQRRSHVLSQAAEEGNVLPEPSQEMIAQAVSQQVASNSKSNNKRLHSELTPLSESNDGEQSNANLKSDQINAPMSSKEPGQDVAIPMTSKQGRHGVKHDNQPHPPTSQNRNEDEQERRSTRRGTKARRHN
jgi:serine/threonine/tyrosine protein kinase RAD53